MEMWFTDLLTQKITSNFSVIWKVQTFFADQGNSNCTVDTDFDILVKKIFSDLFVPWDRDRATLKVTKQTIWHLLHVGFVFQQQETIWRHNLSSFCAGACRFYMHQHRMSYIVEPLSSPSSGSCLLYLVNPRRGLLTLLKMRTADITITMISH